MKLKELLNEEARKTSATAADWEFLISYAWNKLKNPDMGHIKLSKLSGDENPANSIPAWIRDSLDTATKIAKQVDKHVSNNAPMTQIGGGLKSLSVSSEWLSSNKTPKTDMVLGNVSSPIMRISLKQDSGSQLMSGTENDILSVTKAALDATHDIDNNVLVGIKELLEKSSVTLPDTITKIKKNGGNKIAKEDIAALALNQKKLNEMFHKSILISNDFKYYFTKEAMTGLKKFGETSVGAADHLMKFNKNGSASLAPIDKPYIDKIASQVKFNFSFKSMQIGKTGSYKAYTSLRVSDNSKTLESQKPTYLNVLEESINTFLNDDTVLEEGLGDLFDKIKSFVNSTIIKLFDTIKAIAKGGFKNILEFFGFEMDVKVLGTINY